MPDQIAEKVTTLEAELARQADLIAELSARLDALEAPAGRAVKTVRDIKDI